MPESTDFLYISVINPLHSFKILLQKKALGGPRTESIGFLIKEP